jgi:hypothetical protein
MLKRKGHSPRPVTEQEPNAGLITSHSTNNAYIVHYPKNASPSANRSDGAFELPLGHDNRGSGGAVQSGTLHRGSEDSPHECYLR